MSVPNHSKLMVGIVGSPPKGELVIREMAMPADTNAHGDIFGGWLLSQMDLGGSILARDITQCKTVTVAVESMQFLHPVQVGDVISCFARTKKQGNTSVSITLEAWVTSLTQKKSYKVTEGIFVYVAINDRGRPVQIKSLKK